MSNNKQSSVEWLYNKMYEHRGNITIEEYEQAKAMHKEEIIKSMSFAFIDGAKIGAINYESPFTDWEQYYNETYGGNNDNN